MIHIDNLIITGEDEKILSSASLDIRSEESFAIFGPGGSGKSLLLNFMRGNPEKNLSYEFSACTLPSPDKILHFDFNKNKKKHQGEVITTGISHFLIDEPENGFSTEEFKPVFDSIRAQKSTLVFVTHHLEFLENYADRIMVLHYGAYKGTYSNFDFFNNDDPYIAYLAKMGC